MKIYLDNSATSWPKPPQVKEAMVQFMEEIGANPGRSGHRLSIEAARVMYDAREALSTLFHAPDPLRIVFTLNATESINLAVKGLLRPGDHVITSSMEHNSVMRPLRHLGRSGVDISVVSCSREGILAASDVESNVRHNTRMVVLTHASNVTGAVLPIREVGRITRRHGLLFLVDSAQTAGAYPIDMEEDGIDLLAFTGHKSLYGPQGTGGLLIGERINEQEMTPLKEGGTGSHSEFEEQPDFLPDCFESGTPNGPGIAGLLAGVNFVLGTGVDQIRDAETALARRLIAGLKRVSRLQFYGPENDRDRIATISFNIKGRTSSDIAAELERTFSVYSRPGLHCSPAAHRTIGTFPGGTVRFSLGAFNTEDQIDAVIRAVSEISRSG
jgi:cysteine desulfurase / selenocysteine lyase